MTPELLAHAANALREAGALDVWMSEALMKKGRPGVVLHVLAPAADRERLAEAVFSETTTFGLRVVPCAREYVEERRESVKIGKLKVNVRLSFVRGRLATVSPEYDDVRRVATAVGRPARVVYEAAQSAARSRFSGLLTASVRPLRPDATAAPSALHRAPSPSTPPDSPCSKLTVFVPR